MGAKAKRRLSGIMAFLMLFSLTLDGFSFTPNQVVSAATKQIDVWDFGGVSETDTELYNNHLSSTYWNDCENVDQYGKFVAVGGSLEVSMDDLTISYNANDRLYHNAEDATKNYGEWGKSTYTFEDEYTAQAVYYCNGTGGPSKRYLKIANVNKGDKISVYAGLSNNMQETLNFSNIDFGGTQKDSEGITSTPKRFDFVATEDGTYKVYSDTSGGGKCVFYRVVRTPGVNVSGSIDMSEHDISDKSYGLKFVNNTTQQVTDAILTDGSFSAVLAAGYTYTPVLTDALGYGFDNTVAQLTTDVSQVQTGFAGNVLKVVQKDLCDFTGNIVGFDSNYNLTNLQVKFIASEESFEQDIIAELNGTSVSAQLVKGIDYTIEVTGVNDYKVTSNTAVNLTTSVNQDITVAAKAKYQVTGTMVGLADDTIVSDLIFTNEEDSYSYEGTVNGKTYSVQLREGAYSVSAIVDGYRTSSHVVVQDSAVQKDILFVETDAVAPSLEWVSDIYVGYTEKEHNYITVKEAVAAAAAMNPTSEAQRITIHIAPGVYREQIFVTTPYITFMNDDASQEVKLTWYYGIGYRYYSSDASGFYNYENAFDKYAKNIAAKWGVGTYVQATATAFRAEGITFEASFNRYVTEEELADGVEVSKTESINYDRTASSADVKSKAATERATALLVDADQAEFYNCKFLGSQDTLYTGSAATRSYYKECVIEGNTDYIFGDGEVVFDQCELKWFGYSSGAMGGYITAARPNFAQYGYLFNNCTITGNTETGMTVEAGYLGRPWGANAKVTFYNTVLEDSAYILPVGWTSMSGNTAQNANYVEYNTTLADGTKVDLSERITGAVTEDPQPEMKTYFGDWTPSYYVEPVVEKNTIWVIGDSTVSAFNDAYCYPRYGWGTKLQEFVDSDQYEVVNLAVSGASSKDFTTMANYQTLLNGMSEGDFLFIGFGHNDEKTEEARYTNPNGDYTTEGSFAHSLYTNYIAKAQEKGCTPILCTPIVRRTTSDTWPSANLHITSDVVGFPGGDYPQAIRDLGTTLGITVVDMTAMTKELYDSMGVNETLYLHAWTSSKESSVDNTHTNNWGAQYNAYLIAKTIATSHVDKLSDAILTDMITSAPTKEVYYVKNPNYTEKEYDNNLKDSELWNDFGIWKGTVFGAIGAADINQTNFTLGEDTDGNMHIEVRNNKGKIANSQDGIAMYYYKVPVGSTFSLSATATVNSYASNNQVSFGLMARDDMYIDTADSSVLGDYVAAAPLKLATPSALWNSFARKSGVLTQGGTCTEATITAGKSYDLSIVSNSDGYACKWGEEETISAGFDFPLTAVDGDYVYVGMFVSRCADVTFSNIKLIVDGNEVTGEPSTSPSPEVSVEPSTSPTPETTVTPSVAPSVKPSVSPSTSPSVSPSAPTSVKAPVIKKNLEKNKTYTYALKAKTTKLKVTATGKNLTYQWYVNTKNSYSGATKIKGATSASYTPSSAKTGTKYYFVKVTSTDRSKDIKTATVNSNRVKVVVKKQLTKPAKPVINKNLPKKSNGKVMTYSYRKGQKATKLKVTATGKKVTYQWYYSKTNSYKDAVKINGATKSSYTPSTSKKGTGYYFVKITNTDKSKDIPSVTVYSRLVKVSVK